MTELTPDLIEAGWKVSRNGNEIYQTYEFRSFREAVLWMAVMIPDIDRLEHYPEWTNTYSKVKVRLTTDDVGLTDKDIELATRMQRVRGQRPQITLGEPPKAYRAETTLEGSN